LSAKRTRYAAEFKAKVTLEAIKGQRTLNEIATAYNVNPTLIANWKKQTLDHLADLFKTGKTAKTNEDEASVEQLYQQIGQLKVELDWLKKKSGRLS
jgi:transposase-like protein